VTAGNLTFQRLVVTSDDLGPSLPRMRILYAHGAVFVDYTNATTMVSPILVSDRVVGYDTAVYGVNNGTVSGADAGCRITAVITPSTRVDKSTYSTCCLHCHVHHHHRHHALSATATTHPPTTHRHSPSTHPTPLIATHPPTTHRHSPTHPSSPLTHPPLIATHPPTKTSIAKLHMHACTSTTTAHHHARMHSCTHHHARTQVASPILFRHPTQSHVHVAATKLSSFVTGRFGPTVAWAELWPQLLHLAAPTLPPLPAPWEWTPTVHPSFSKDEPLPQGALEAAARRGVEWLRLRSALLPGPSAIAAICDELDPAHVDTRSPLSNCSYGECKHRAPAQADPLGDGRMGVLEGYTNLVQTDGAQYQVKCKAMQLLSSRKCT
jgi:hypothetical protein